MVEIYPLDATLGERVPADMIHDRGRYIDDAESLEMDAPAEIDLLHVGKEHLVEQTSLVQDRPANEHADTARPEDLHGIVVLASVDLHVSHEAPTGERIPVDVHQTAGRTGIFEVRFVLKGTDLGLARAHLGVFFGHVNELLHAAWLDLGVIVEEKNILPV